MLLFSFLVCFCNVSDAKYFAEIGEGNVVRRVIVADNIEWCQQHLGGEWVETFKDKDNEIVNSKNYCGKGYTYLPDKADFHPIKPYSSWILNGTNNRWKAPIVKPIDGKRYKWNEVNLKWEEDI